MTKGEKIMTAKLPKMAQLKLNIINNSKPIIDNAISEGLSIREIDTVLNYLSNWNRRKICGDVELYEATTLEEAWKDFTEGSTKTLH